MILHSQIIGNGKPFVILHGFLGMGDNWKSLANRFAENGFEVHLLDQRNHGRSFHSDDFNYKLLSYDLKAYCDYHELDEIVLLGHSMGGKTAMEFATLNPNRVSKLIIVDIGPKAYPPHHQDIVKALSVLDLETLRTRGSADQELSAYIHDLGTRQFLLKNLYWKEKGRLGLRVNLAVLSGKMNEIGKALSDGRTFSGEVLFLKGEKSNYIEKFDEVLIRKHFPKALIETVSEAGHWVHAENPSEFYRNVVNFL